MDDFPDPEEEFELMYGDELELLNEQDEEMYKPSPPKCRKSINMNSASPSAPSTSALNQTTAIVDSIQFVENNLSSPGLTVYNETAITSQTTTELQSNKKRTIEELFGDIDDIGDDDILTCYELPYAKKSKSNNHEDENLAIIERIVQLRKLSKDKNSLMSVKNNYAVCNVDRDKRNLSYRVPKYPFITVTRGDNERIYVRFHSEEFETEDTERIARECSFRGVMGDGFRDVWQEAQNLINAQINLANASQVDSDLSIVQQVDGNEKLWVDLYKPRKYLELLSDESTNRIMLRWMKLWDKVVFNRKPKIKPMKSEESSKNKFLKRQELNTNLDEHGRPEHKVALLCGPPGLGKTTLAHMVARHAGYNVVEINASDDRNLEAFKTCLENATQMRSVIDRERRPNCLIFDEIDGAPQASIDYLVKFISGTVSSKAKKGKSEKTIILKRPIICICNDVYVPALRPLRQIAFVVNFPPISSARLAERLMEIARKQNVKTDVGAMLALAEKSNKDIRSCLSVLHFFKAQNKPVTLSEIHKNSIGQKDVQKGLFSVWQSIFKVENSKVPNTTDTNSHKENLKSRMQRILQTVSSFGDYERVAQGVFENYVLLKLKDSSFGGICESLDWFVFSDVLHRQVYEQQNYSLTSYLQYAFVIWHFVFGTTYSQKLNYPSAGYEAKLKESRQKALVSEVLRGVQVSVRPYCQRISLILDILPFLIRIIVPPFRPVNLHLYTKEERESMLKVVHIMIDYNLNYIQQRAPDGTYSYNLEPNVQDIAIFDNSERFKRRALSYSNMQLIAREIELEKMRRFETARTSEISKQNTVNPGSKVAQKNKASTELPNHLQTLKAKTVKTVKPTVTRDFFGRVITKVAPSSGRSVATSNNDIWYQYKEGYNNAVRKKVLMSSFK